MRTARKNGQTKSVSASKSSTSSRTSIAEAGGIIENLHNQARRNGWVLPLGMDRVPTHTVSVPHERRAYPRANLRLPVRITRIAGRRETQSASFQTIDISSSGLRARFPMIIEPGTPVNLEVELVSRPGGRGSVRLITEAHVVRVQSNGKSGWHALAFCFDDITFERDELMPPSFADH